MVYHLVCVGLHVPCSGFTFNCFNCIYRYKRKLSMKYQLTFTHGLNRPSLDTLREMFPAVTFTRFGAHMETNPNELVLTSVYRYMDNANFAVQMDWIEKQRAIDIGNRIIARHKASQEAEVAPLRSTHETTCKK